MLWEHFCLHDVILELKFGCYNVFWYCTGITLVQESLHSLEVFFSINLCFLLSSFTSYITTDSICWLKFHNCNISLYIYIFMYVCMYEVSGFWFHIIPTKSKHDFLCIFLPFFIRFFELHICISETLSWLSSPWYLHLCQFCIAVPYSWKYVVK